MHSPDHGPAEAGHGGAEALTRSGALAGFLSFILPGLGQWAAGARLRGTLMALPVLLLIGFLVGTFVTDKVLIARVLLNPTLLLVIVWLSLAFMLYRLWAIVDAYRTARSGRRAGSMSRQAASVTVMVALLAITVVMHGYAAFVGWQAHDTLVAVFDPSGPGDGSPTPLPAPTRSAQPNETPAPPTPTPLPTPTPAPEWAADGRLNVLLVGSDAGPGRLSQRADAIILVSVDIGSGRVAAFSLPRYTKNVPLPEPVASNFACKCFSADYINAIYRYAELNPNLFPGEGETKGWMALSGAIEALYNITLDGMAVADLNGFVKMVDAVGGVTVNVPAEVYDAQYPDPDGVTLREVHFLPGVQEMDGWTALAYARTRHQDGDVSRMARQQTVIRALGAKLSCNLLFSLPSILQVAKDTLWTNLPLEDVPDMLRIDPGPVESHVLFDTHNVTLDDATVERLRNEVKHAFDGPPPPDDSPPIDC